MTTAKTATKGYKMITKRPQTTAREHVMNTELLELLQKDA